MFSPTDLDAAIKDTFAAAGDIPPDKTRALLTAVDQDGVKLIVAQRLPDGWQLKGYVDEPWVGGLQYGVTLEKTW